MSESLTEKLKAAADYCLLCKNPFCVGGCPARVNIPGMMANVQNGDYQAAYNEDRKSNVLPLFCGILCPHEKQCEGHCIRIRKGKPVDIGFVEHGVATLFQNHIEKVDERLKHLHIGIVGGGMTGISAAFQLSIYGAKVTLYEKHKRIGGAVERYLPKFRFDDSILAKIYDNLIELGVKIEFGKELGTNLSYDDLTEYDYRIIAIGAQNPISLSIFKDTPSVFQGIDILKIAKDKKELPLKKKRVLVIGAGNVAMDVSRTLRRAQNEVIVVYRRTLKESPAAIKEILDARDDGVQFMELLSPYEPIIEEGQLVALKFQKMELDGEDGEKRRGIHPLEPAEFETLACDGIVLSLGGRTDHSWMGAALSETFLNENKRLKTEGFESEDKHVYFGGDYLTGPQTVVKAMAAGRDIARQILIREMYPKSGEQIMLGGSFNPPTLAHIEMIKCLRDQYDVDILLVPNGDSYLRKSLLPFPHRAEMLKLATEGMEGIKILDIENNYPFRGSVTTLRELNHPKFAIGADSLKDFKTWIEYHDLVIENEFLVFGRDQIDIDAVIAEDEWLREYQDHFHLLPCEIPSISSTKFRKTLEPELLDPKVYQYIVRNNLYKINKVKK